MVDLGPGRHGWLWLGPAAVCPARLFALEFGEGKCQLGGVHPLHTTCDMSPCSITTLCLCFGGAPASSRAPTIHCDILPCHLTWRRPGWGGHQLSQEGVGLSAPKLTWLGGHEACCACHALTMQGVGGVPPMLLPEAHILLTWEWTQLLAAPPSGAAPHPPCSSCCCFPYASIPY